LTKPASAARAAAHSAVDSPARPVPGCRFWPNISFTGSRISNPGRGNLVTEKSANKMWGGRFSMSPAEVMEEINASIGFDKALAPQDIRASKAHAAMLAAQGIIAKDDAKRIVAGLDRVLEEIEAGRLQFSRALADVHMNVESRLEELIGAPARRLH